MDKMALSIDEAAKAAGVGRDTIYSAINSGTLVTAKIGKRRLIRPEALRQWLEAAEQRTTKEMGFAA